MILLAVLNGSRVRKIEAYETPGLASQAARRYTDSGVTCRIVPPDFAETLEGLEVSREGIREEPVPLTFSSEVVEIETKKCSDDLVILRRG